MRRIRIIIAVGLCLDIVKGSKGVSERRMISRNFSDEAARWVADVDAGLLTPEMGVHLSRRLEVDQLYPEVYDRTNLLWAALLRQEAARIAHGAASGSRA